MGDLSPSCDYGGCKHSFFVKVIRSLKIKSILDGKMRNNNIKFDGLAFESKKNSQLTEALGIKNKSLRWIPGALAFVPT